MQKKRNTKLLSLLLSMVLIVAMALSMTGCNGKDKSGEAQVNDTQTTVQESTEADTESGIQVLGEGQTKFDFSVVDQDGNETQYEIHTDKKTVGEALQDLKLIDGEEGDYGLYVKTVNGITADYDTDGTYWAFYVDGEYAQSGVDMTDITDGASYSFKIEK